MPRTAYPLRIIGVTKDTSWEKYVTEETVSSVTGARKLARFLGYRVCTVGGLCELDTSGDTPRWVITVWA